MLANMNFGELFVRIKWYFDNKQAENLEQWRMVRRLCFYQALTGFGKVEINGIEVKREEHLWDIEGDVKQVVDENRVLRWRQWMIDNGKMKGEA